MTVHSHRARLYKWPYVRDPHPVFPDTKRLSNPTSGAYPRHFRTDCSSSPGDCVGISGQGFMAARVPFCGILCSYGINWCSCGPAPPRRPGGHFSPHLFRLNRIRASGEPNHPIAEGRSDLMPTSRLNLLRRRGAARRVLIAQRSGPQAACHPALKRTDLQNVITAIGAQMTATELRSDTRQTQITELRSEDSKLRSTGCKFSSGSTALERAVR